MVTGLKIPKRLAQTSRLCKRQTLQVLFVGSDLLEMEVHDFVAFCGSPGITDKSMLVAVWDHIPVMALELIQ